MFNRFHNVQAFSIPQNT